MIGRCKQKREASDYDDFYIASKEEAEEQIQIARKTIDVISEWHAGRKQSSWFIVGIKGIGSFRVLPNPIMVKSPG